MDLNPRLLQGRRRVALGIGRHETAMSRLVDVPCCAREWYLATVASFMRCAQALEGARA